MNRTDICVVIPTYNNAGTLEAVLEKTLLQGLDIIVVNDGSTDGTTDLTEKYVNQITLLSYTVNRGKGFALRQGFAEARRQGFSYAVTIDSDGQHDPNDIPLLIAKHHETANAVIIGARNMTIDNVPTKSAFGRRFSNFWFWVETGKRCKDTQSGFRLYPLEPLTNKHFYTSRFEFEIESLVRLAWDNIPIREVEISVIYFSKEQRISHFRPATDFFRISVLNSILVMAAYLWFLPGLFFRRMKEKTWKEILLNPRESNLTLAKSLAFGVFMGIIPIWGFQMIAAFALAAILGLNKTLVLIASNISIPPMIPFIIFGSLWFGNLVLQTEHVIKFSADLSFQNISNMMLQYVSGSIILATAAAGITFAISYGLLKTIRKNYEL
jgi:glycosyltransferase involved in cell wall biosynthesis